nr:replication protein A 32 kDa subunit B isoform X1 [Ipomoea batatas]
MYGGSASFDGNAAFAGGGFMPSQATQTATDPSYSSSKSRDSQSLLPLTVKQIIDAVHSSDDKINFLVDGVDVNNVKLVGIVFNMTDRATDFSFVLDDGTGRIDCYRWLNESFDKMEMAAISNGMYVKLHGHLKGFQGKKQLMTYSVRPLDDYNEIAHHFAEAIYAYCHNTKLRKLQDSANTATHVPNSAMNTPMKGYQVSQPNFSGYNVDGITGIEKMVLSYLQQPQCLALEKGVHRNELAQQLNVPIDKILPAMESLESEGLVYSTIDECHYKSTGNG